MASSDPKASPDRGAALLMALFGVMILAGLALGVQGRARGDFALVALEARKARLEAAGEAGVALATARLIEDEAAQTGPPWTASFEGAALTIRIGREGGRIDLNGAPDDLLRRALAPYGASLADRVLAARAQGRAFQDVAELVGLGARPEATPALEALFTTHAGGAGLDLLAASDEALRAVPGAEPEAERLIAWRARRRGPMPELGALAAIGANPEPLFRIHAAASDAGGAALETMALVWFDPQGEAHRLLTRRRFIAGTALTDPGR